MIQDLSISAIPKIRNFKEFNLHTHQVVDLFLRYLEEFKCSSFKKIAIKIHSSKPRKKIVEAGDILMIHIERDLDSFFILDDIQRKYWILKKLKNSFQLINEHYSIDMNKITSAYEKCLSVNLINSYYYGDIKYSGNKEYYGQIHCLHNSKHFEISAHIFNNLGQMIKNEILVSTAPYWSEYLNYLGAVKSDGENFILVSVDLSRKLSCRFI